MLPGTNTSGIIEITADEKLQAPPNLDLARSAVAREELDVLVYPDIGMEPLTYFMAYARLAPIQVRCPPRSWS